MDAAVVYVVDDDSAVCQSIALLAQAMGLRCETFSSGEEFLDSAPPQARGCLITDIRMLGMSGLQLMEAMSKREWCLPTIVVTAYADVRLTIEVVRAGATTLLEKPYREQELWDSIVESLKISEREFETLSLRKDITQRISLLTMDEMLVFRSMIDGVPNKTIAATLDIAPRTVDLRRQSVLRKLGSPSVIHTLRLFSKAGISIEDACGASQGDSEK